MTAATATEMAAPLHRRERRRRPRCAAAVGDWRPTTTSSSSLAMILPVAVAAAVAFAALSSSFSSSSSVFADAVEIRYADEAARVAVEGSGATIPPPADADGGEVGSTAGDAESDGVDSSSSSERDGDGGEKEMGGSDGDGVAGDPSSPSEAKIGGGTSGASTTAGEEVAAAPSAGEEVGDSDPSDGASNEGDGDIDGNGGEAQTSTEESPGDRSRRPLDLDALTRDHASAHPDEHSDAGLDDSIFDPVASDPSCAGEDGAAEECNSPPDSTIETETVPRQQLQIDATWVYGGDDFEEEECPEEGGDDDYKNASSSSRSEGDEREGTHQCRKRSEREVKRDKHWGSDLKTIRMRDRLRKMSDEGEQSFDSSDLDAGRRDDGKSGRPPVFLMPGLASTRLVSWRHKSCKDTNPLLSDIKVRDYVWLNMNLLLQMATIDDRCWTGCLTLGPNQGDGGHGANGGGNDGNATDGADGSANANGNANANIGCKLRADEGLDAISSLAPGSVTSDFLIGGTNTVYAWLTQWLADNLGYDVTSIVGLPYDWRLSPDVMERRDGFLTLTRRRIEAAVRSNGRPGVMVAHSMGNLVFRYFLEWLRVELREEAYERFVRQEERRREAKKRRNEQQQQQRRDGGVEGKITTGEGGGEGRPGWLGGGAQKGQQQRQQQSRQAVAPVSAFKGAGGEGSAEGADVDADADGGISERVQNIASALTTGLDGLIRTYFDVNEEGLAVRVGEEDDDPYDDTDDDGDDAARLAELRELSLHEGDAAWLNWIDHHIWTFVGLSAPLMGAIGPLRAVLSGESMGLPISDAVARNMELSFGSTHTANPISTAMGFCDESMGGRRSADRGSLACLDELVRDIERSRGNGDGDVGGASSTSYAQEEELGEDKAKTKKDVWRDFPALRRLLLDRVDWDTDFPMVGVTRERCSKGERPPCDDADPPLNFSAADAQSGELFKQFSEIWTEEGDPLGVKYNQLRTSWWEPSASGRGVPNPLNSTWDRPHIKHVIMAYGVDVPTEVGYMYRKSESSPDKPPTKKGSGSGEKSSGDTPAKTYDPIPPVQTVIKEERGGIIMEESLLAPSRTKSFKEKILKQGGQRRRPLNDGDGDGSLEHSGDGTIPYLSLSWAHTWLLHANRAMRHSLGGGMDQEGPFEDQRVKVDENGSEQRRGNKNPLDSIRISHRPRGGSKWIEGSRYDAKGRGADEEGDEADGDTGTSHPHGTKYKPEMVRFQSSGKSRSTGIHYTTTVIEAIGVEHKETTRNYDILAAVFTDVLKHMHDDFGLV